MGALDGQGERSAYRGVAHGLTEWDLLVQIKKYGIGSLWYGAFATAAATFVGHYPVS